MFKCHRRLFAFLGFAFVCLGAHAQIAPECVGLINESTINDVEQRAFLQNYFATSMMMTPMGPVIPYGEAKAGIGLEIGYIPSLTCQQRAVIFGGQTKTENTNITPVLPRPRLTVQLPNAGPISFAAGLSIVPPIPLPMGTLLQAGGDVAVGWRSSFGFGIGARGHLNISHVRAEFITPLQPSDPVHDDLFLTSSFGGDLGLLYQLPWEPVEWLTPFASIGYAGVRMLTYIGDDGKLEQNPDRSWSGAMAAGGLQALLFDKHFEIAVEVSSAIPIFTTVKGKVGYVW